jgi:tetratricopeptide (TPR) repeat protein
VEVVGRRIEYETAQSPDARDLVMRGRAWLHRPRSAATRQEAQCLFERALKLDSRSVEARIWLATGLLSNVLDGWSTSSQQDEARAEQLLRKALEDDTNRPMAHLAMGLLCRLRNQLIEARIEFETAIALDRNNANAYRHLGITLMHLGEPEAGVPHIEKAIRLNPRHSDLAGHYWALGACHLLLGHLDHATDLLRRARAGNPGYWYVYLWLASAFGLKGDFHEAGIALAESIKLQPQVNLLAQRRAYSPWTTNPRYMELANKTLYVGLRRAGFPDE